MDTHALRQMTVRLHELLVVAESRGVLDRSLLSRHAYYTAAYHLSTRGFEVQVLDERSVRQADLYLPSVPCRVKVGYTVRRSDGSAIFSLGSGPALTNGTFDLYVAVAYDKDRPDDSWTPYVLSFDEAYELYTTPKGKTPGFASTPYALYIARDLAQFKRMLGRHRMPRTLLEEHILTHQEEYAGAWGKASSGK
ncbi:MAG: hypothetical protein PHW58_05355 [Candidatus Methanofastidiosa archaeon]|nr:hypothetical protein [Candidatus Methanofastidiosa archaeon]